MVSKRSNCQLVSPAFPPRVVMMNDWAKMFEEPKINAKAARSLSY
jgi:hypothetical protein